MRERERLRILTDCGFRLRDVGKLNDTHSFRTSALKQNLSELNLPGGLKEFNEIFVGG
jgi:hypothetical protein